MREAYMTFSRNSTWASRHVEVRLPTFGYIVNIKKSLIIQRFSQSVGVFDRGRSYDYRTCVVQLMIPQSQMDAFAHDAALRNESPDFALYLPYNSGFYPAGSDMGDSGEFHVSIEVEPRQYSAMRVNPFGFFDVKLKLLFHDLPDVPHSAIASPREYGGTWDFGDVLGLRDPIITPSQEWGVISNLSIGGKHSRVDYPTDDLTTKITQRASTDKMAELVAYIQHNRGEPITVNAGSNFWLFGGGQQEKGQQTVRLLDSTMRLTHSSLDRWETSFSLWRDLGVAP